MVRDWRRRENSAPSASLITEQACCKINTANGQEESYSDKESIPIYLWENKFISTKPSFQDKQKDNSTYLQLIKDTKNNIKVQRMNFFFFFILRNQNLSPYGLDTGRAKNIIPESQIRADSSVKATVCDGIITLHAFYHFPRIPFCIKSLLRLTCGRAPLAIILMV